jgi:hypothetical protein
LRTEFIAAAGFWQLQMVDLELNNYELDEMVKLHHNRDQPKSYFTEEKQFADFLRNSHCS